MKYCKKEMFCKLFFEVAEEERLKYLFVAQFARFGGTKTEIYS